MEESSTPGQDIWYKSSLPILNTDNKTNQVKALAK